MLDAPVHPARRKPWLQRLYRRYHRTAPIAMDPLARVAATPSAADREIVAVIASSLAYGNVKAILKGIDAALALMRSAPHDYLLHHRPADIRRRFAGYRYRVTSGEDFAALLIGLRSILRAHGSLGAFMAAAHRAEDETILPAAGRFVDAVVEASGACLHHLLPHPDRGSACKRLNLCFRWMCRRDRIDPGGWDLPTAKLVIPLDVHMHRVALRLGLTRRRQPNLATALEVTAALRDICPDDPLRYDFCLTRPGILNEPFPED